MIGLIFAAGIGSRLKPWTDLHPKALVPVGNKPMLQRVIENMVAIGINEIIVNVHHFPDQIIEFLDANNNFGINLHISDESHQLLDTGGAILRVASRLLPHDHILL
ncbi:MAG: NTP transferase domain-containing protein, partial [Muribaculaceae bacterium]|nr:NTP transferase domain-containing protein [Muribaculaceae bacterium]